MPIGQSKRPRPRSWRLGTSATALLSLSTPCPMTRKQPYAGISIAVTTISSLKEILLFISPCAKRKSRTSSASVTAATVGSTGARPCLRCSRLFRQVFISRKGVASFAFHLAGNRHLNFSRQAMQAKGGVGVAQHKFALAVVGVLHQQLLTAPALASHR